jgi:predicted CoA-binding protein
MPTTTRADINDFLAQRRLAIVGVSRNPKDFSRTLFRDLCSRNYDMVPVNPLVREVEGKTCFPRVQDIEPPVEGALLMTPPAQAERAVHDCAEAGIRRVWMYRAGGPAAVSSETIEFCKQNKIRLVAGYCPYMFFPGTQFIHRLHGLFLKLTGGYPGKPANLTPRSSAAR